MLITVRLYRQFDMDLIYLAHYEDFSLIRVAKSCICAYANGTAYRIALPEGRLASGSEDKTTYVYTFKLNDKKEAKSVTFLKSVRKHHRNSFIKNLIRGYLIAPFTYPYLGDIETVKNGNEAFDCLTPGRSIICPPEKIRQRQHLPAKPGDSQTGDENDEPMPISTPRSRKRDAIDALGSIILAPRDADADITGTRESGNTADSSAKAPPQISPPPATEGDARKTTGFDLFETLSGMMKDY